MTAMDRGPRGTIVDGETFDFIAELEVRKAVRLQYYVSLLAVQPEVEGGEDAPDPGALASQLARVISQQIRGTDLVGLTRSVPNIHILLINANLRDLPAVIQRILQEVNRHRFQVNGHSKAARLSVGGSCFPATASTRQDLFAQASTLLADARRAREPRHRYRLSSVRPESPGLC